MKLYLVRHGETGSNLQGALDTAIPGADLSEAGLVQAHALAERFAQATIDALYASPLVRTQQTIAPLSNTLGMPPIILDGLREVGAGEWEMRNDEEAVIGYMTAVSAWLNGDTSYRVSGGETGDEFLARFDRAVETIVNRTPETALLVSHGAAIRTWVHHRCDLSDWTGLEFSSLPNTGVIELEGDPQGWSVLDWTPVPQHIIDSYAEKLRK